MKLELKHLAPYLPYGLKIYQEDLREHINPFYWVLGSQTNIRDVLDNQNKPILRPLSDLDKHSPELISDFNLIGLPKKELDCINGCSYEFVIELLKAHFDIFGLIEKNLAIDINTLNE